MDSLFWNDEIESALRNYRKFHVENNIEERNNIFLTKLKKPFELLIGKYVYSYTKRDMTDAIHNDCLMHLFEHGVKYSPSDLKSYGESYISTMIRAFIRDFERKAYNEKVNRISYNP